MLKIRLLRIGAKQKPFYRVVAVDERTKRTGAYIELLGTYNPLTEPKDIKLKQDRIDYWIKQGAQPSTGYLRIIGKAPQRLPRKPKKEKKTETPRAAAEETKPKEEKVAEAADTPEELKTEERSNESTQPVPQSPEASENQETSKPKQETETNESNDTTNEAPAEGTQTNEGATTDERPS